MNSNIDQLVDSIMGKIAKKWPANNYENHSIEILPTPNHLNIQPRFTAKVRAFSKSLQDTIYEAKQGNSVEDALSNLEQGLK